MKKRAWSRNAYLILTILVACSMLLLAGCTSPARIPVSREPDEAWMTMELFDVQTKERFSLASLPEKPVILYTFTVSCPVCTLQQREIAALVTGTNGSVVSVGLDIDPNEEPDILKDHIRKNGFPGYYAISPPEMTRALVDRFGPGVVTPASAPVMVICPGGDAEILSPGIKSSLFLASSLERVC